MTTSDERKVDLWVSFALRFGAGAPDVANYVDWQGNRWWMDEDEILYCAPLNADGTPDLEGLGEPEELHEKVRDALRLLLFAGGGW